MSSNQKVRAESMWYGIVIVGILEWITETEASIFDGSESHVVSAENWIVEPV